MPTSQQSTQQGQQKQGAGFNPFVVDPTGMPPIDFSQHIPLDIPQSFGQQPSPQVPGPTPVAQGTTPTPHASKQDQSIPPFTIPSPSFSPTEPEPQVNFSFELEQNTTPNEHIPTLSESQFSTPLVNFSQSAPNQPFSHVSQGEQQAGTFVQQNQSAGVAFGDLPQESEHAYDFQPNSLDSAGFGSGDFSDFSGEQPFASQEQGSGFGENADMSETEDENTPFSFTPSVGESEADSEKSVSEEDGSSMTLPEVYFDLKVLVQELMEMVGETTNYTAVGQREPTNLEYIFTLTSEPLGLIITRDETFPDTGENTVHTLQFIEKEDTVTVLFQDVHLLDVAIDGDDETDAGSLVKKKLLLLTKLLRCDYEVLIKQRDEALKKQAIMAELAKF